MPRSAVAGADAHSGDAGPLASERSRRTRRIFKLIARAYVNQTAGPRWDDPEQLRAWLLCEAGWCRTWVFDEVPIKVIAALREAGAKVFFYGAGHRVVMRRAKSLKDDVCSDSQLEEIERRIEAVVCGQLVPGATAEGLLKARSE